MKTKKSPEEKLIGQIDRLLDKNKDDNILIEKLSWRASEKTHSTNPETRKEYMELKDSIESISKTVQRRSHALKNKKEKLAEIQTVELPI